MASEEMERFTRILDESFPEDEPEAGHPAPRPDEVTFRRLVVGVDGSRGSGHAIEWSADLARRLGARVAIVHAMPTAAMLVSAAARGVPGADRLEEALERRARAYVDSAAARLRSADVEVDTFIVPGRPVRVLLDVVEATRADLVVLGARGTRPVAGALLGSVVDGVKNHAPASVLVAKGPPRPRRVLAGTDGSSESRLAVATAVRLARAWSAPTLILHVRPRPADAPPPVGLPAKARDPGLPEPGPLVGYATETGDPAQRILEVADERACDLVVLGARGSGALHTLVAGSVGNRVSHLAKASVLLVKTTGWARTRRILEEEARARRREDEARTAPSLPKAARDAARPSPQRL